jgi:hypothetical protein
MKITFYVGPRQSGKTQRSLERYSENPESTVLFVHDSRNSARLKDIMNRMGIENPVIRSAEQMGSVKEIMSVPNPRLKDKTHVICDEYLFWSERSRIAFLSFLQSHSNIEEVIVFSSLDKFYDLSPKTEIEKYLFEKSKKEDYSNLIYRADVIIKMPETYNQFRVKRLDEEDTLTASRFK